MTDDRGTAALILAAGEGTRMKSSLAKVLHRVGGRSMIRHVLDSVRGISPHRIIVIVGHQAESVKEELSGERVEFVLQAQRLGTGHAALQARSLLEDFAGTVVVMNGDTPLLKTETLLDLLRFHGREEASATVLSAVVEDASGYGRIKRGEKGVCLGIIEHRDASEEEKKIKEINAGIFCFECADLFRALEKVKRGNVQGEYYITDVMGILRGEGKETRVYLCRDPHEVLGINDLQQLEAAERLMRENG
ncbi:MAG: NTP transferase domain-containing protein [Candidatus Krumholzibacteriota bacterium]|nr:NTP transferase domain-containing protein [Candidatus Krumholzibacteriota bacterium]